MRYSILGLTALVALSATAAFGGELSKETTTSLRQTSERADKMASGKVAEFAKDYLEAAKLRLFMAQAAGAAGNEKLTLQHMEMAQLQLTVAEAKAAEKEVAEEVALNRAELKRLEAQLERYMQPEEK